MTIFSNAVTLSESKKVAAFCNAFLKLNQNIFSPARMGRGEK